MAEETSNKNLRDDEIDLLDLFRRIGRSINRGAAALGKAFLISVVFLIRRWFPLTISVFLGIGISILMWKTSSSFYTADLVLRANIQPTDALISHVNRLHVFSREANTELMAQSIGIPGDQAKNILDIQAFWIIDNGNDKIPDYVDYEDDHSVYDTTNLRMDDRFDVRVRIKQPQELTKVRDGILNFLNSEPLFLQKNSLRLKQNAELLTRLEIDINELDSLQKYKFFEESKMIPKSGGQFVFLQEQKTQLLYQDIYNLYSRKQAMEAEQTIYKDVVTVLSEFTIPSERDNGITYYLKIFVPLFFITMLLLLIAFANKIIIQEVYKKY
ncbi:MAG TPA: hypothetical protein VK213_00910 [Bacteroidales bacterium]|nr:hypothetical protein [Bacteroidales bacterium]